MGCVPRGLIFQKSGNSFMTGRRRYREKEVFSQGIFRKNNRRAAVDVFIYVFVNQALQIGSEGVGEREENRTC